MSAAVVTVGEMTLRGIVRRRLSLVLLLALPLAFYLARHSQPWQAVRFLGIGLAWATSTVALFAAIAARSAEPRLRVGGWSWRDLVAGRVGALLALGIVLAAPYFVLIAVDRPVGRIAATGLMLLVTAVTGVAVGSALGAFVARELEGALLLFIVAGMQFVADPPTLLAHLLPFWSTRELATYAIEGAAAGSLGDAFAHAAATVLICTLATVTLSARRLRLRR
ncbi:hypothetical protein [Conexibacter woesei]|uniref:ABC transporter permease n=1 Tax=Conexibacter woesei (strain DSM 14684 / CCUG 47730 / CIP 108061 / JCM 11494 / NBRC 100937 / ID131577) TaxID=469383 RepID=D3FBF0_CONWI|nr:hypothetical protein [Conexibacter woesei]ADB49319.1 hypothetical protein Cwoe_0886 [Conexibacter woesei DSM 14684]